MNRALPIPKNKQANFANFISALDNSEKTERPVENQALFLKPIMAKHIELTIQVANPAQYMAFGT